MQLSWAWANQDQFSLGTAFNDCTCLNSIKINKHIIFHIEFDTYLLRKLIPWAIECDARRRIVWKCCQESPWALEQWAGIVPTRKARATQLQAAPGLLPWAGQAQFPMSSRSPYARQMNFSDDCRHPHDTVWFPTSLCDYSLQGWTYHLFYNKGR